MGDLTVRLVEGDERLAVIRELPGYAFNSTPPLKDSETWQEMLDDRPSAEYLALFEGERPMACVAYLPMTQGVRGQVYRMGGVFDVATRPDARRKGYATRLLRELFAHMHTADYPFSGLYPFRESFYENLGYASFPQSRLAKFSPANLHRLLKTPLEGEVELCLLNECYEQYYAFLDAYQPLQPGMGRFAGRPEHPGKKYPYWVAFAKRDGEVRGAMLYAMRGDRPLHYLMHVTRFYYLDHASRYLLLEWMARHVDQAETVNLLLAPGEQPETWLPDLEMQVKGENFRGMGRVLDVAGLEGINAGPGEFSVSILDAYCPWNEGVWQFRGAGGKLQVERAQEGASPQCELKIQALSAWVYGTHHPADFAFRGWGAAPSAVQQAMQQIFPLQQAYMHEFF